MLWARFRRGGHLGYGQLEGDSLTVYSGDISSGAAPTGQSVKLAEVELLTPCDPSKMICLWNNFHALAAKLEVAEPPEPLYFLKAPSAFPRSEERRVGKECVSTFRSRRSQSN